MKKLWNAIRFTFPAAEFLVAWCIAARAAIKKHGWVVVFAIPDALAVLFGIKLLREETVCDKTYALRLASCACCPIYYEPFRSCGNPRLPNFDGCGCHMPTKARFKENCWLYDKSGGESEFGWPRELNSFPIDKDTDE